MSQRSYRVSYEGGNFRVKGHSRQQATDRVHRLIGKEAVFTIKVIRAPTKRKHKEFYRCIYCKQTKPRNEYTHRKTGGITGECHSCARERQLERRIRKDIETKGVKWLRAKIERDRYVLAKYEAGLRAIVEGK